MKYRSLTKKVLIDNQECVACAAYGTSECKIHTGEAKGCSDCSVLAAIFNQLYAFEEAYTDK